MMHQALGLLSSPALRELPSLLLDPCPPPLPPRPSVAEGPAHMGQPQLPPSSIACPSRPPIGKRPLSAGGFGGSSIEGPSGREGEAGGRAGKRARAEMEVEAEVGGAQQQPGRGRGGTGSQQAGLRGGGAGLEEDDDEEEDECALIL